MGALEKEAERVEKKLAARFRPLLDEELTVTFHDQTTDLIREENSLKDDIRVYGKSDGVGGIARQFTLGFAQRAGGLRPMRRVHFPLQEIPIQRAFRGRRNRQNRQWALLQEGCAKIGALVGIMIVGANGETCRQSLAGPVWQRVPRRSG